LRPRRDPAAVMPSVAPAEDPACPPAGVRAGTAGGGRAGLPAPPMGRPVPPTVVFFDGSCPLCRSEIAFYRKRDAAGALSLVDVADPAAALPPGLDRARAMARFHVLGADVRLRSGARAFAELWRQVPGWRRLGALAATPGIAPLVEGVYRLTLVLRPALVRLHRALRPGRPAPAPIPTPTPASTPAPSARRADPA
jgi:predicted DCC family thiol-disulfide oxidoreductase YuxK